MSAFKFKNMYNLLQVLLKNHALVEAANHKGQRPLHIACKGDSINNVVALVVEGEANIFSKDVNQDTPFHYTRNEMIVNIMLKSAEAYSNVFNLVDKNGTSLYQLILTKFPNSLPYFLDLMISSGTVECFLPDEGTISYDITMFAPGQKKSENYLDILYQLIERGLSKHLKHPIMRLCLDMEWHNTLIIYFWNMFLFILFLTSFSTYGYFYIQMSQCQSIDSTCFFAGHPTYGKRICKNDNFCSDYSCKNFQWIDKNGPIGFLDITSCLKAHPWTFNKSLITIKVFFYTTLVMLVLSPIMRLINMFFKYCCTRSERRSITIKDWAEGLIVLYTVLFLVFQDVNVWLARNFLGWGLFVSWMYVTILLARFDIFGKHFIISWRIMKKVVWSFIIYIPSLIAFAFAFYCFLVGYNVFNGFSSSTVKILTMMIGALPLLDDGGQNYSVKVLFNVFYYSIVQ